MNPTRFVLCPELVCEIGSRNRLQVSTNSDHCTLREDFCGHELHIFYSKLIILSDLWSGRIVFLFRESLIKK